jgi:hypothetical protein
MRFKVETCGNKNCSGENKKSFSHVLIYWISIPCKKTDFGE